MAETSGRIGLAGLADRMVTRCAEFSSYFLVGVGAVSILVALWLVLISQVGYERKDTIERAIFRNEGIVFAYEEFALRTLQNADTVTHVMEALLKDNSPEDSFRKLNDSGIIDGELFHSVGLEDADGNLVASSLGPDVPKFNYADRQYFQAAARQQSSALIIGVPIDSRITHRVEVPVVRRLSKSDGAFDGLVVVQVSAKAFTNVYRNFGIRGHDYIALIGFDGIARAAQIGAVDAPGRDFNETNVMALQSRVPNSSFVATGGADGIRRYISYRTLPGYPLFVATGVEENEALQTFNQRKERYLAAGGVSSLLIGLFAAVLIVMLMVKDMKNAKLRRNEEQLKDLATHDALTSLPNRTLLATRAAAAIAAAKAHGREVACIFVDLDNFGQINEAFGHLVGDEVLKAVAGAIRASIGSECTPGRIGGDEFLIIAPAEKDAEKCALDAAAALHEEFRKLHLVAGKRVDVRASVGISRYPHDGDNLFDLIRCADAAMLQSKATRRAMPCVFTATMNREAERRLKIRLELADALKREELEVFYQPQVSLSTQMVTGVEALVRWRHPVRGILPPAEFIPVAEESGLIVALGEWVLNKACVDGEALRREGHGSLSIAVNVSALQFRQPGLVEVIANVLRSSRLAPCALELELTESVVADDPAGIVARLIRLKDLGIRLALDDFGTGYSNLQYLRKFPFDILKIDRSFVTDLPESGPAAAIAEAIVGLGQSLGLSILAEGVETKEQQKFLAEAGCHAAQGYLFAKPMPLDELKGWLRAKREVILAA
jgi:diguanylate cyclase (GGDEF)-like protein